MNIIIDSNILIADYTWSNPHSFLLAKYHSLIPAKVYISQVSIDEVCNKREFHKNEKEIELLQAANSLRRMTFINTSQDQDIKLESKDEFESKLLSFLSSNGIKILPYPKISHSDIVKYSASGKKPFKNNDSGYKDFLIWTSVKDLLNSDNDILLFVTNDGDFQKDKTLHKDLVDDILRSNIDPERVIIFNSLKDLNNCHLINNFSSEPVAAILNNEQILSLVRMVEYNLLHQLKGNCVSNTNIKTSHKYEDVIIEKIESIDKIELSNASHIESNKIQITADSMSTVIINYWVDSIFMDSLSENAEILDFDDGVATVSELKQICTQTSIVYDISKGVIESIWTYDLNG
jgi:predicted nucleic acid-binding protein